MEWVDRSVLEAVSWRLASELFRRHPTGLSLIRGFPGGGQSDCLWLLPAGLPKGSKHGDVRLNRHGTIQVLERFDGRPPGAWEPTAWDDYLRADPREFLLRLEAGAGLPVPQQVPASTPSGLVYRVLAAIAATAVKSVRPIEIQMGVTDTSGYGGGPLLAGFQAFAIPQSLLQPQQGDPHGEPGDRFWFVSRAGEFILALEQREGLAWTRHHQTASSIPNLYAESRRHLLVTALKLLRRADGV